MLKPFSEEIEKLHKQRYIANMRDIKHRVKSNLFPAQLNKMMILLKPPVPEGSDGGNGFSEPVVEYITSSTIKVNFSKKQLRSLEDVDDYVEALREAMKEQISKRKRIRL